MSQYRYSFFFNPDIWYGYSTYVLSKLQHTKLVWRVSTLSFVVESKRKFKNPSLLEAPLKFNWRRFLLLILAGKAEGTTNFISIKHAACFFSGRFLHLCTLSFKLVSVDLLKSSTNFKLLHQEMESAICFANFEGGLHRVLGGVHWKWPTIIHAQGYFNRQVTWQTTKIPIAEKGHTIVHLICLEGGS